ncbi:unnamed protein product [Zymoseptoria tritici ST99CH_3D7]|uniref:PEBP-like protein n=2 Tax=Zymoseptoria tritici TaxID=1047171 RepID=A0A1X7RGF5_ZYMT9|nr:unnamed protein product [Zymoseptoria tritici ST99CH_3D7]
MKLAIPLTALVAISQALTTNEQKPLHSSSDLISELIKAEIIPTVLDTFHPLLTVTLTWPPKHYRKDKPNDKHRTQLGNTLKPKYVQRRPRIELLSDLPDVFNSISAVAGGDHERDHPQLTLVLTDPDARSRDDPDWSEMCHWIVTDVPLILPSTPKLSSSLSSNQDVEIEMQEIMPYKPPGPPASTGKHRYVAVALAPINGTMEKLRLSRPADRKHWGYGGERVGVRQWAEENGLGVVGANFIYAQDKKQ